MESKTLIALFIVLVLDLTAFTCILPLFPAIMDFYASRNNRDWLYEKCDESLISFRMLIGAPDVPRLNSVFFGGLLGSLFCALQFISSPMIGALSDIYGRKPVMFIAAIGSLCSYLLWSYASTFTIFLLSRIVGGLSKASVSVATALIADICPPKRRGKGMALIGMAFSIAFLVGPMIGACFAQQAITSDFSFSRPALLSIILTIAELLIIWTILPETLLLSSEKRKRSATDIIVNWKAYVHPKSLINFVPVSGFLSASALGKACVYGRTYFLYLFLYSGLEFTLTFFTHIRFHFDSMQQGRMYLFTGLMMISVQGGYVRRITMGNHLGAAQWGLAMIVPGFILIGISQTLPVLYIGLALYAFASAVVVPCLTTVVLDLAIDENHKGALLGIFRSLGALARAVGPLSASAVYWCIGPTLCYILGGILLALPYLLLCKRTKIDDAVRT